MEDKFRDKNIDGIAGEPVSLSTKSDSKSDSHSIFANQFLSYSFIVIAIAILVYVANVVFFEETPEPESTKKLNARIELLEKQVVGLKQEIELLKKEIKQKPKEEQGFFPWFYNSK